MKRIIPLLGLLNFYSKFDKFLKLILIFFGIFCAIEDGYALSLNGIYFGTCQRDVGVILKVNEEQIQFLTLEGKIKHISRFDIIYLADYPIGIIPIQKIINANETEVFKIKTLYNNQSSDLVQGWPVGFSEANVLFFTTEGDELVIERDQIFSLEGITPPKTIEFKHDRKVNFIFEHPAIFSHCNHKENQTSSNNFAKIYPQQLLGDPLLIKKTLDFLMDGRKEIVGYNRDQVFYAVPYIFHNDTTIGLWYNVGSRHGANDRRSNNLVPMLISEVSEGPFSFQRVIVTGVAPMPFSIHEEPQTQFIYHLKAAYFHFSVFFDPSTILLGSNYQWKKDDFETQDDRLAETLHINAGFDFGPFVTEIAIVGMYAGVRNEELFATPELGGLRFGLAYQNRFFKSQLYYMDGLNIQKEIDPSSDTSKSSAIVGEPVVGEGAAFKTSLRHYRLNIEIDYLKSFRPQYSLIYRKYFFDREPDLLDLGEFQYSSESITNALYITYELINDISLRGYISIEAVSREYESQGRDSESSSKMYQKMGASLALTF